MAAPDATNTPPAGPAPVAAAVGVPPAAPLLRVSGGGQEQAARRDWMAAESSARSVAWACKLQSRQHTSRIALSFLS